MSKNTRTRILLTAVAALLLVTMTIGGTLAWLTDTSDTVTNTFKPSNVAVDVDETTGNTYQVIPGVAITKDPEVTATANVDSWVFVKVTKSDNWPTGVTFTKADGWTELEDGVWYRELLVEEDANDVATQVTETWQVLANDTLTVANNVNVTAEFTLNFDAYIIQKAGFDTAAAAWAELNP